MAQNLTWLKVIRETKGYDREELAQKVGISLDRYLNLERGSGRIKHSEALLLSSVLGVPLSRFTKISRRKR